MSNVVNLTEPRDPYGFMVGPFEYHRVIVEGRAIPNLTAHRDGPGQIALVIDHRFSVTVPADLGESVAWLIANAMAIAAGYPSMNAETKDRPFAPRCAELSEIPK
jgi:hypothetical protein